MKFSIVTCTWNSAATLADTLESVAAQQGVAVEQVFVDGGSTDGTLDMIAARCPGATVLRDVRGGISRAMNVGIDASTGDVIAHLHSDDYYAHPEVLLHVQQALQANPSTQWLVGRIDVWRDGMRHDCGPPPAPLNRSTFARGAVSIPHPAVFVRRELFARAGRFSEQLKYAMDIDLWLRLLRDHPPVVLAEVLAVFREHEGSVSTANVLAARLEERRVRRARFASQPLDTLIYELRFQRRFRRLKAKLAEAS